MTDYNHIYYEVLHTPSLSKHTHIQIQFYLVVDNFGVKYINKDNIAHLLNTLKENYDMNEDWEGKLYCGITLQWNYNKRILKITMPGYASQQLTKYKHNSPAKPVSTPFIPKPRTYGKDSQKIDPPETTEPTTTLETKLIQQVVRSFLCYARAVDMKILYALSNIASTQAQSM